jgi:hypothetical protein
MRFWYIIPNLLRDLVTIMLEHVQGLVMLPKNPQGRGYPQSRQNYTGLSNSFFMRDKKRKSDFKGMF